MALSDSSIVSPPQKWLKTVGFMIKLTGRCRLIAVFKSLPPNFTMVLLFMVLNSRNILYSSASDLDEKATAVSSKDTFETGFINWIVMQGKDSASSTVINLFFV